MASNKSNKTCTCVKCIKSISQRSSSIQCDECKSIFHIRCTNITHKILKKVTATKTVFSFVCEFCKFCRCGHCNVPVFNTQNYITCDNPECSLKYHIKCTIISLKAYNLLKNKGELWICKNCYSFPFDTITKNSFFSLNHDKMEISIRKFVTNNPNFGSKCTICCKKIRRDKVNKSMPCKS